MTFSNICLIGCETLQTRTNLLLLKEKSFIESFNRAIIVTCGCIKRWDRENNTCFAKNVNAICLIWRLQPYNPRRSNGYKHKKSA